MRTRIKVADLSLAQWAWLNKNLPGDQVFAPGDVRMCVELEITAEQAPVHVELPARAFIVLIERLAQVEQGRELLSTTNQVRYLTSEDAVAMARALDAPLCEHGALAVKETPSAFESAKPILTYADGCQSYGPYQNEGRPVLPSVEQVRNMAIEDLADLARRMNLDGPVVLP